MRITPDDSIPAQVPEDLEEEVISRYHNNLLHRHLGITRTIELIKRHHKFLNMRDKVSKFIKNCVSC
jgi:hypothetical protein